MGPGVFLLCIACLLANIIGVQSDFGQLKERHSFKEFNDAQLRHLASLTDRNDMQNLLNNIMIPRVVGTPNHDKVRNYIIKELEDLGYDVEVDEFQEDTPNMGTLTFRNLIGRLNPQADRYLVLTCHYDSKYFAKEVFVGATDSAVPCAMMLNLAKVMKSHLDQAKSKRDVSLMLLFLDGEEAFQRWGPKDSIYGARHLADKWQRNLQATRDGANVSDLERVDALVLLDLIGAPNPTFFSYFPKTERLFVRFADAQDRLAKMRKLERFSKNRRYFRRISSPSFVEDDHIPFMIRGVPILHLIPKEFPKVWHTPADDANAIDMPTIEDLNKILRVFVAEYMHLSIPTLNEDEFNENQRIDEEL